MFRSLPAHRIGAQNLLLALLVPLAQALPAQQQLDREIAFVRALVKDMRLVELARRETEELAKSNVSGGDTEKIAALAAEVAYYGARSRRDRVQQRALFKETLARSKELIDAATNPAVRLAVRATFANACRDFGQFLIEEIDIARESAPDRVKDLEQEAAPVFRAGITACTEVMEALQGDKDEQKKTDFYLMWMQKAVLSREQGRADKQNRSVLVSRAITELSELTLEAGEETAIGLRGLFEIAMCKEVDGRVGPAIADYQNTIRQIAASLEQARKGELDLPVELQGFLFEMLQEVSLRTGEAMLREGAPEAAELFAGFRRHVAAFGAPGVDLLDAVSDDHGHLMLLAEARFLAESGDTKRIGEAVATTQRIHDRHPADYVGQRAKLALRDMLARQRNLVSGSLLFEVAKGEMQNKNYEEAIIGLRRAIPAMTATEQRQFGLEAYEMMGLAYAQGDRHLEAMLAFTEGLSRFRANDPAKASDVADACNRALSAHKRLTHNDPGFASFYNVVARRIAESSVGAGSKLYWKEANDRFNERHFAEAIAAYAQVTPDFVHYEAALVNIAKAHAAAGDFAAARTALATFRGHVDRTPLPAGDTQRQQVRSEALADAEFTEVGIAYFEARGSAEFTLQGDLTKYPAALEKAQAFLTNFAKGGERHLPHVLEYIGRLQTDLGRLDLAEAAYKQLQARDELRASRLATGIFKEYQGQVKSLGDELDRAIAAGKPDDEISKATAEVNAMRGKLVALGTDYIAASPKPQLAILIGTMLAWEQLREWPRVEMVARKALELYGAETDEGTKQAVDRQVRAKLGEALLQQRRFTEAYDMLVAAEKADPTHWECKRQVCRALGGWFEWNSAGMKVIEPGLDRPAEAYNKYFQEYRAWALRSEVKPFSLDWYRFHWELYWFANQAAAKDGKMKDIADKIYRIARSTDDFATLKGHGAAGMLLFRYFQANH